MGPGLQSSVSRSIESVDIVTMDCVRADLLIFNQNAYSVFAESECDPRRQMERSHDAPKANESRVASRLFAHFEIALL